MAGNLGACMRGVHCILLPMNDVLVDSVLHVGTCIGSAEDPLVVGFVLSEQQRDIPFEIEKSVSQYSVGSSHRSEAIVRNDLLQGRLGWLGPPTPGIAKPQSREHMKRGRLRSPIAHTNLNQDVLRRLLCVLHKDVKVAIVVKDSG